MRKRLTRIQDGIIFVGVLLIVIGWGCKRNTLQHNTKGERVEIARANDHILYNYELPEFVAQTPEDSVRMTQEYVTNWVRQHVMFDKACKALGKETERIERQVDDYRTRLYMDAYEKIIGVKHIDTVVSKETIEKYYEENTGYFLLSEPLVRVVLIRVPIGHSALAELRNATRSVRNEETLQSFSTLTMQHGILPQLLPTDWHLLSNVEKELPQPFPTEFNGRAARFMELQKDEWVYLLSFVTWLPAGEKKPLEYVASEVHSLILRDRLIQWRTKEQERLMLEGIRSGNIKYKQ